MYGIWTQGLLRIVILKGYDLLGVEWMRGGVEMIWEVMMGGNIIYW